MASYGHIVEAVKRKGLVLGGIATAASYVRGLGPCMDDEACADRYFGLGQRNQYAEALKAAEDQLVYRNDMMKVIPATELDLKQIQMNTPGAVLDFACIVTATSKDRDGDVLESGGGELDESAPLLWQHIPVQPIGKVVKKLSQTDSDIRAWCAVANTELGRDAATLIEFGALRISHGFAPMEFAPLPVTKADMEPGWHIRRFKIYEVSVVSIPSNERAVITAVSRSKLHHPLVKAWAESLWEKNPLMVKGIELPWAKCYCGPVCGCNGKGAPTSTGDISPSDVDTGNVTGDTNKEPPPEKPEPTEEQIDEQEVAGIARDLNIMEGLKVTDSYGHAFVHHGEKSVHYVARPQAPPDMITLAHGRFSKCKGVKQVQIKNEVPERDKGWRQVHPSVMDHKALGDDTNSGGTNVVPVVESSKCKHPGCTAIAQKGSQYCESHASEYAKLEPKRWNRTWSKAFDVDLMPLEPSTTLYDWVSKYIGCRICEIRPNSITIPGARMGSMLTGLKLSLAANYKLDSVRNIKYDGTESPPDYETIQLTSKQRDTFLVDGSAFYRRTSDGVRFVVDFTPHFAGIGIKICTDDKNTELSNQLIDSMVDWAKANNFLKGEAFSLGGEFIDKTSEEFEDVFLEQKNKESIVRTIKALNDKGINFSRGAVWCGPPGTGKTLSGRVIRNKADATFIWLSSRDFHMSGSFGGIALGFELARELAPSVLFMEDVDNWLHETTIDLLKTEMDGIKRSSGVWTILTTNFPEDLPDALIDRPGRFHDILKFDLPDSKARTEMVSKWLPKLDKESAKTLVGKTAGYSGAHVYELCQFAKTHEEDGMDIAAAVAESLRKVEEQKELITSMQLAGSHYKPSRRRELSLVKYSADQPRDDHGRFTSGGNESMSKVAERHSAERREMHERHDNEAEDQSSRHIAEHIAAELNGRQTFDEPEPSGTAEKVRQTEQRHERERQEMRDRHENEAEDQSSRHIAEQVVAQVGKDGKNVKPSWTKYDPDQPRDSDGKFGSGHGETDEDRGKRHYREQKELSDRHFEENRKMSERHEAELSAAKGADRLATMDRHGKEEEEVFARQQKEQNDVVDRQEAENDAREATYDRHKDEKEELTSKHEEEQNNLERRQDKERNQFERDQDKSESDEEKEVERERSKEDSAKGVERDKEDRDTERQRAIEDEKTRQEREAKHPDWAAAKEALNDRQMQERRDLHTQADDRIRRGETSNRIEDLAKQDIKHEAERAALDKEWDKKTGGDSTRFRKEDEKLKKERAKEDAKLVAKRDKEDEEVNNTRDDEDAERAETQQDERSTRDEALQERHGVEQEQLRQRHANEKRELAARHEVERLKALQELIRKSFDPEQQRDSHGRFAAQGDHDARQQAEKDALSGRHESEQKELEAKHEKEESDRQEKHKAETSQRQERQRLEHGLAPDDEKSAVADRHAEEEEEEEERQGKESDEMEGRHSKEVKALEDRHGREEERLTKQHEREDEDREGAKQTALEQLDKSHERERDDFQTDRDAKVEALEEEHSVKVEGLEKRHDREESKLERDLPRLMEKEDDAVGRSREKEDAVTEKAREKEDRDIEKARAKEDKDLAKSRERNTSASPETWNQVNKEQAELKQRHEQENKERQAAWAARWPHVAVGSEEWKAAGKASSDMIQQHNAEESTLIEKHDKLTNGELSKRLDEDEAIWERRDHEDGALTDKRDAEDKARDEKRDVEDKARDVRQKEHAEEQHDSLAERHGKETDALKEMLDAEKDSLEKQFDAAFEVMTNRHEKEREELSSKEQFGLQLKDYDPNQPRDADGRFGSVSGKEDGGKKQSWQAKRSSDAKAEASKLASKAKDGKLTAEDKEALTTHLSNMTRKDLDAFNREQNLGKVDAKYKDRVVDKIKDKLSERSENQASQVKAGLSTMLDRQRDSEERYNRAFEAAQMSQVDRDAASKSETKAIANLEEYLKKQYGSDDAKKDRDAFDSIDSAMKVFDKGAGQLQEDYGPVVGTAIATVASLGHLAGWMAMFGMDAASSFTPSLAMVATGNAFAHYGFAGEAGALAATAPLIGIANAVKKVFGKGKAVDMSNAEAVSEIAMKWLDKMQDEFMIDVMDKVSFQESKESIGERAEAMGTALCGLLGDDAEATADAISTKSVLLNFAKSVVAYSATKMAPADKVWDADAAMDRLRTWAGVNGEDPSEAQWAKYAKGFTVIDGDKDQFGSYKLPHHDIIGGNLTVVFRGVAAALGAVHGTRGGMDLGADKAGAIKHLEKHYRQFGEEPPKNLADFEEKGMTINKGKMTRPDHEKIGEAMKHVRYAAEHDEMPDKGNAMCEKALELLEAVHEKHAPPTAEKLHGRVTKEDHGKLCEAAAQIQSVKDMEGMHHECKAFASKAYRLVKEVADKHAPSDTEEPEEKNVTAGNAHKLLGGLLRGDEVDYATLHHLKDAIVERISEIDQKEALVLATQK